MLTTALAVVFGLMFAWLMSRRMIQPVEVLIGGLRSVEQGDLTVLLQVRTTDEIGVLTRSFNKLVERVPRQGTAQGDLRQVRRIPRSWRASLLKPVAG